jgi:prepilin-type N-terminal cleavage/methylation domain-containing protein
MIVNNKDNKGFSLIEIIVTIAILSVLVGVATYSYSMVNGKQADECARKLASTLSHARTTTMGKYWDKIKLTSSSESGIQISEDILIDDSSDNGTAKRDTTVGSSSVTIKYKYGKMDYADLPEAGLEIRFNSGTGALVEPTNEGRLIFEISKAGTVKYVIINSLTGNISVSSSEN